MSKYLLKFSNESNYQSFVNSANYVTPNVSYCVAEQSVKYNPYTPSGSKTNPIIAINISEDEGGGEIICQLPEDAEGNCHYYLNDVSYGEEPVRDGASRKYVMGLTPGTYSVHVHYSGDSNYLEADDYGTMTVF